MKRKKKASNRMTKSIRQKTEIDPICRKIWETAAAFESSHSDDSYDNNLDSSTDSASFPSSAHCKEVAKQTIHFPRKTCVKTNVGPLTRSEFFNQQSQDFGLVEPENMGVPDAVICNDSKSYLKKKGQLNLVICASQEKLTVTLLGLKSLGISSIEEQCTAYVYLKLSLSPDVKHRVRFKTSLQKITLSATELHETFTFDLMTSSCSASRKRLLISAWCKTDDEERAIFIGCMSFGIKNILQFDKVSHGWYYLLDESLGRKKHVKVREKKPSRRVARRVSSFREEGLCSITKPVVNSLSSDGSSCYSSATEDEKFYSSLPRRSTIVGSNGFERTKENSRFSKRRISIETRTLRQKKRRKRFQSGDLYEKHHSHESLFRFRESEACAAAVLRHPAIKEAVVHKSIEISRLQLKSKQNDETKTSSESINSDIDVKAVLGREGFPEASRMWKSNAQKRELGTQLDVSDAEDLPFQLDKESNTVELTYSDPNKSSRLSGARNIFLSSPQTDVPSTSDLTSVAGNTSGSHGTSASQESLTSQSLLSPNDRGYHSDASLPPCCDKFEENVPCKPENGVNSDKSDFSDTSTLHQMNEGSAAENLEHDNFQLPQLLLHVDELQPPLDQRTDKPNKRRRSIKLWFQQWPSSEKQPVSSKSVNGDVSEDQENMIKYPAKPKRRSGFWKSIRSENVASVEENSISTVTSLQELLRSKAGESAFRKFLSAEFSEENLDFWLECEALKITKDSKLHKVAAKIYDRFIAPGSVDEININGEISKSIKNSLNDPSKTLFDEAQKHVFLLMEKDSFRRFQNSCSTVNCA